MAQKTYVPTLLSVATRMCKLVATATPVISRLYSDRPALLAALAAANAACATLSEELSAVREYGD